MSLKKQYLFIKKLEALYRTNRSLALTIESLSKNEPNAFVRRSFAKISEEIKAGSSLSAALEKSDVLDDVYCKLIQVGETSGKLDKVLTQILELIDNLIQLRRKIISTAVYPVAVVAVYYLLAHVFFLIVIPMLVNFMKNSIVGVPPFLQVVTTVINPFSCCCCVPVFLMLIAVGIYVFININTLAYLRGMIMVFIPGFGHLDKLKNMFSYIYTMKICYESGMSVFDAAELSSYNLTNEYLAVKFDCIPDYINRGDTIADAIASTRLFNFDMIDIIRVGEESGTLDESYGEVIRLINDKVNLIIAFIVGMMKPLGIVIGLLMLAAFFICLGALVLFMLKSALPG